MIYHLSMFPPGNPKNGVLLRELRELGITEVSHDFEFIFEADKELQPRLIEIANRHMRNLGWHEDKEEMKG